MNIKNIKVEIANVRQCPVCSGYDPECIKRNGGGLIILDPITI